MLKLDTYTWHRLSPSCAIKMCTWYPWHCILMAHWTAITSAAYPPAASVPRADSGTAAWHGQLQVGVPSLAVDYGGCLMASLTSCRRNAFRYAS